MMPEPIYVRKKYTQNICKEKAGFGDLIPE
jgi:hypothetical protein